MNLSVVFFVYFLWSGLSTKLDNNSFNASHGTDFRVIRTDFLTNFFNSRNPKIDQRKPFSSLCWDRDWPLARYLSSSVLTWKNRRLLTLHKTFRNSRQICFRLNRSADERISKPQLRSSGCGKCQFFLSLYFTSKHVFLGFQFALPIVFNSYSTVVSLRRPFKPAILFWILYLLRYFNSKLFSFD